MMKKIGGVSLLVLGWGLAVSCARDDREVQLAFSNLGSDAGTGAAPGDGVTLMPRLDIAPTSVDLGWVTMGFPARARVRITNSGDAPLATPGIDWSSNEGRDFELIQNQCSRELAPAQSCEARVQLIPTRAGDLTATLRVESSPAGTGDVAMAALGLEAGELILAPAVGSFENFGGVRLGATVEGSFTVSNPSAEESGPLAFQVNRPELSLLPPTGAAGECVPGMTSLADGQSCNLRLAFTPVERGPLEATLTSRSDGAGSVSLALAGQGIVPGVLASSSATLDFDGVVLGDGALRSVTFSNDGDEPLTLVGASLAPVTAEGFSIQNSDCGAGRVLAAAEDCSVRLEFRPPRVGEEMTAELLIEAVEGQQRQAVGLRGIGLEAGALTVAPITVGDDDFGPVLLDGSLVRAFQVTNPTAQPSGVLTLRTSDGFEVLTPPGPGECVEGSTSLVDGEGCTVRVAFTPLRRAAHDGALTVASALAGATSVPLRGQGIVAAAIEVEPEINFGRVFTNAPSSRTLIVRNEGDESLVPPNLELTSASDAQAMAFSYESACTGALGAGEQCEITLRFAPTRPVPHSANLKLTAEPGGAAVVLLLAEAITPGSLVLAAAQGSSSDFGDVAVGNSATSSFTLTHPGSTPSGRLTIRTDDSRFEAQEGDCNQGDSAGLVDGTSCSFSVRFSPDTALEVVTSLSVQSAAAGQTGIELRGRGRSAATLTATGNRDLGRANLGQATLTQPENEFTWTVSNDGDLPSGALQVANDNPTEFEQTNDTCSNAQLAGHSSCQMTIRFRPSDAGARTASVVVTDPLSNRSATLVLTGVGVRLAALGESCVNATCATGTCTGGVCCDRACDGTCQVCSAAGVCNDQSNREQCGNGAGRCFGVNRCLLPEGQACGQGGDCGNGNCERRLGGQGLNDRICCLTDCDATGQQCNAQGQCQQPTLAAGAVCGRAGDLPCGGALECKSCLGGGSRCTPANECCGGCQPGYECIDGDSCGCGLQANGTRMIDCGGGLCIQNRANACCPATPSCSAARPTATRRITSAKSASPPANARAPIVPAPQGCAGARPTPETAATAAALGAISAAKRATADAPVTPRPATAGAQARSSSSTASAG